MEQLKPPEFLSLERSRTETWKWQLQYSLKLLKANGNEDQLEGMKSSTCAIYIGSDCMAMAWKWRKIPYKCPYVPYYCYSMDLFLMPLRVPWDTTQGCLPTAWACGCWCYYSTKELVALLLPQQTSPQGQQHVMLLFQHLCNTAGLEHSCLPSASALKSNIK